MARDIEEFLRRAAERKQQKQGQQPGSPQSLQSAPPVSRSKADTPNRQRSSGGDRDEIIEDVEVLYEAPASRSQQRPRQPGDIDGDQAHPDMGPSRFSKKSKPQLGKKVAEVGQKFERAVHEHLDHDLSKVETSRKKSGAKEARAAAAPESSLASGLRKMLARPETIGQAILISEILKRPNFDDE
jgi:hypothetical protein